MGLRLDEEGFGLGWKCMFVVIKLSCYCSRKDISRPINQVGLSAWPTVAVHHRQTPPIGKTCSLSIRSVLNRSRKNMVGHEESYPCLPGVLPT